MDRDIGKRLKQIRLRLGLSQRQLARQSGVANATISQIEAGKLNPTVSMLKKVLDGVPISMSEFFADDMDFAERIFFRADELTEIAEGGVSFRQVGASLHNKSIQLLKECYQPGAGTGRHAPGPRGPRRGRPGRPDAPGRAGPALRAEAPAGGLIRRRGHRVETPVAPRVQAVRPPTRRRPGSRRRSASPASPGTASQPCSSRATSASDAAASRSSSRP